MNSVEAFTNEGPCSQSDPSSSNVEFCTSNFVQNIPDLFIRLVGRKCETAASIVPVSGSLLSNVVTNSEALSTSIVKQIEEIIDRKLANFTSMRTLDILLQNKNSEKFCKSNILKEKTKKQKNIRRR